MIFRHSPVSLSQPEVAGVVITRTIVFQITFEEILLQPPSTGTKHKENHKENITLEWMSFRHPTVLLLSQTEAAGVAITRSIIFQVTFEEVPFQHPQHRHKTN